MTTIKEWYELHTFENSQVVVKNSSVVQRLERKTVNFDVAGSIPAGGAESWYNRKPPLPYGSRSVKPVKWGNMVIVAELVKRLIVVQEIVGSSPIFHT